MDIKKGVTIHHHHISFTLIIMIILILALILTIKPAFIGYKLNKEFEDLGTNAAEFLRNLDLLNSKILISETNLGNCNKSKQQYLKQITNEKNLTLKCQDEKREIQSKFDILKSEYKYNLTKIITEHKKNKTQAQLELNQLKIQFNELTNLHKTVIQNAANNK